MWWKVELDKTGAILVCEQVAQGFNGSKYVRFIEAETKAEACASAKDWWQKKLAACRESKARLREARIQKGLCPSCNVPARPGRRYCERHAREIADAMARGPVGDPRVGAKTAEERLAYACQPSFRASVILRELDARGPELFRAWLVSLIEAAKLGPRPRGRQPLARPMAEAAE